MRLSVPVMLYGASDTTSIDTHCKRTILAGTCTNRDGFYSRHSLDQSRGAPMKAPILARNGNGGASGAHDKHSSVVIRTGRSCAIRLHEHDIAVRGDDEVASRWHKLRQHGTLS
jgi:hypothetical protein